LRFLVFFDIGMRLYRATPAGSTSAGLPMSRRPG